MADMLDLQRDIHRNSVDHGFWKASDNIGEKLMLIVSELSEALEEYRNDRMDLYFVGKPVPGANVRIDLNGHVRYDFGGVEISEEEAMTDRKPEGFGIELADATIRILDLSGFLGLDMGALVELKMAYNKTRPHLHGRRV